MEALHQEQEISGEYFKNICEFERRQSDWYLEAFGGACPARAVFDAYENQVLNDEDFASASKVLLEARDRYFDQHDPTSMSQLNTPLLEAIDRPKRSHYLDD